MWVGKTRRPLGVAPTVTQYLLLILLICVSLC